jgi:hypothetical protein
MKNITKFIYMAFATVALLMTACSPNDNYQLGEASFTADQVSFTYKSDTKDNIIVFTNTSDIKIPTSSEWNLGNGVVTKDKSPRGLYPEAGTYTVSLTVTSTDGTSVTISQTINIAKDDPTLFDTPVYRNLTGGADNTNGKTWVLDQWNLYSAEVKAATGININGHLGSGPLNATGPDWWNAVPNEKSAWKIYDFKLTFSMANGLNLHIVSGGEGYAPIGYNGNPFTATMTEQYDMGFVYDGGDYNFSINDAGEYPVLKLSGNAFMAYYPGTQEYEILYLTDEVMALRARGADTRTYVFIREDLNKEPDIPTINDDNVTLKVTQGSDEFTYNYSVVVINPENAKFTTEIQFGDGQTSTELEGSHTYVLPKGTYTMNCVISVDGGKQITKQQQIVLNNDNPLYNISESLTGGKSWKLRPYSQGSGIIMTRTWTGDVWWTVDASAKGSGAAYDDVLTFFDGGRVVIENHGDSYMNESTGALFPDGNTSGSFVTTNYKPSNNARWELVDVNGKPNLKLTNVFPMYAVSPAAMEGGLYEIVLAADNLLHIAYVAGTGEWDATWNYYLIPAN